MTDVEKAIVWLEQIIAETKSDFENELGLSEHLKAEMKEQVEVCETSVVSLEEQQERDKGCECCKDDYGPCLIEQDEITISYYERDKCFYDNGEVLNWSYCPICGRKLREEKDND